MRYNPFKAHVVEFGDGYAVRKFSLGTFTFKYLDRQDMGMWWYSKEYHRKYCWHKTLDAAIQACVTVRKSKVVFQ